MTNKFHAKTLKSWARVLIALAFMLLCIVPLFILPWRYNAFPAEKRIAKNIEQAAYGSEYKKDLDYCIPHPGLPVCSTELLPMTECYTPRCRWGHVTDLALYGTQLEQMPTDIVELPGLETLVLSHNQITGLPPEIGLLRNLTELDLSDNQLTNLPPEIGQLRNLTELDLSSNQLTSLPPEIGQLTHLNFLDVSNNPLSGPLPKFLTNLPLHSFRFSNLCVPVDEDFQAWIRSVSYINNYGVAPSDLCSLVAEDQSAMLALYELPGHPTDWDLQTLPCTWSEVGCDSAGHIVSLNLFSSTKFSQLPPEIGQLEHLQNLSLSNTPLTELPPEIGNLLSLRYLDLGRNQFTSLPPEMGQLHNLQTLYLGFNQLRELPPEIGQLRNLQTLYLGFNQLTELPPEMGLLTNLKSLDVSNNPLSGPLPAFLTKLPNVLFTFEHTNLCVPQDDAILDWLQEEQTRFPPMYNYDAGTGQFVYVLPPADPQAYIDWMLENRGCK